jgi:ketosteroid isomerase-like protein
MIILLLAVALQAAFSPAAPASDLAQLRAKDQALLDAIAPGDRTLWARTMTSDAVYVDENGDILDRAKFLENLTPLPAGSSGHITIIAYDGVVHGNVALVRHRDDEREIFHGEALHAEYLMTETWLRRGGVWKLALTHAHVVAVDPPAIPLDAQTLDDLVGRYVFADLTYTIRRDGDHLISAKGSGTAHPLLAETPDVLFAPGRPRTRIVVVRDPAGRVLRLIERREGENVVWTRAQN